MSSIKYNNISKAHFDEFLESLKIASIDEYNNESKDGFVDLYDYWDNIVDQRSGLRRFNSKLIANYEKFKCK